MYWIQKVFHVSLHLLLWKVYSYDKIKEKIYAPDKLKIWGKSSRIYIYIYIYIYNKCTVLATSLLPAFFLHCLNLKDGTDAVPKRCYPITNVSHVTSKNSDDPNYAVAENWNIPKGRLWVLKHCCLEAYCTLTRMSSFIHLQRRCTYQAAWETSASERRNYTWNLS